VHIVPVTTVAAAVSAAGANTTLLVTPSPLLSDEQAAMLAGVRGDLVVIDPGAVLVDTVTGGRVGLATIATLTT
jgi:hypothetical protein